MKLDVTENVIASLGLDPVRIAAADLLRWLEGYSNPDDTTKKLQDRLAKALDDLNETALRTSAPKMREMLTQLDACLPATFSGEICVTMHLLAVLVRIRAFVQGGAK